MHLFRRARNGCDTKLCNKRHMESPAICIHTVSQFFGERGSSCVRKSLRFIHHFKGTLARFNMRKERMHMKRNEDKIYCVKTPTVRNLSTSEVKRYLFALIAHSGKRAKTSLIWEMTGGVVLVVFRVRTVEKFWWPLVTREMQERTNGFDVVILPTDISEKMEFVNSTRFSLIFLRRELERRDLICNFPDRCKNVVSNKAATFGRCWSWAGANLILPYANTPIKVACNHPASCRTGSNNPHSQNFLLHLNRANYL